FAKRVKPREVAMPAGGRAGAGVADLARVVAALQGSVGELLLFGDVFPDAVDGGRNVIEKPVVEAIAASRVWIMEDAGEEFGFLRRSFPGEFGGNVFTFAGEAFGEFAFVTKYRT